MTVTARLELTSKGLKLLTLSTLTLILSGVTWRAEVAAFSLFLYSLVLIEIYRVSSAGSGCRLEVLERRVSRRIVVGSTSEVIVRLRVEGGRGMMRIVDNVPATLKVESGDSSWWGFKSEGAANLTLRYVIKPAYRGRHYLGPLIGYYEGPLSICRLYVPVLGDEQRIVEAVPVFYTYSVRPVATSRRIAAPPGGHPIRVEGSGTEFIHLRPYSPGDDYRRIAWKATAKRPDQNPIVKVVQSEIQLNVLVVVDASESTLLGPDGRKIIDDIVECAGAIITTAYRLGDRVGLLILSDRTFYAPPSRRKDLVYLSLRNLEVTWPSKGRVSLGWALDAVARTLSKRTLIIILSPLETRLDEVKRLIRGLRSLGHLPAVLIVDTVEYAPKVLEGEGFRRVHDFIVKDERERLSRVATASLMSGAIAVDLFNSRNAVEKALKLYYGLRGMSQ